MQRIRRNANLTTPYGLDDSTEITGFRYHRGIDYGTHGDQMNYCPEEAIRAIVEPVHPDFGTLIRLIYRDREVRIAHGKPFEPAFQAMVSTASPIPEGLPLAKIAKIGTANGPHSHIEVLSCRTRNPIFDKIYEENGIIPGMYYSQDFINDHQQHNAIAAYMAKLGLAKIGPHECYGWDNRNQCYSYWYDPYILGY